MKQIYSHSHRELLIQKVADEICHLEGLPVFEWYRGMAHTLHLKFGKQYIEETKESREHVSAEYSLFLHGEWKLEQNAKQISSLHSSGAEIDSFLQKYSNLKCTKVKIDLDSRILILTFSDDLRLSIFDQHNSWFVLQKFGEYSYSPKENGLVEVTDIRLES